MRYLQFLRAKFYIEVVVVRDNKLNCWVEVWIPDDLKEEVGEFFNFDLSSKMVSDEKYAMFILTFL